MSTPSFGGPPQSPVTSAQSPTILPQQNPLSGGEVSPAATEYDDEISGFEPVFDFNVGSSAQYTFPPIFDTPGQDEIIELNYAGQDLNCIPETERDIDSYSVGLLDLSFNNISALRGVEVFKNLTDLILDNNCLIHFNLPYLPKLTLLSLNKNKLSDLNAVVNTLKMSAPTLSYLSLMFNPLCPVSFVRLAETDGDDYRTYRYRLINSLEQLKFLDSQEITVNEREVALKHLHYQRILRPTQFPKQQDYPSNKYHGTPLKPAKDPTISRRRVTCFSKVTREYQGTNSEGNRFICNDEL